MSWDPVKAKEDVANDVHFGYELHFAKQLHPKLPKSYETLEDILAEFRVYAIEACDLYKYTPKVAFTTFLYRHLQIRSYQWLNSAWLQKNQPKDSWVLPFSAFSKAEQEDDSFDPTSERPTQRLTYQLSELMDRLSLRSRELLQYLFDVVKDAEHTADLLSAFKSKKRVGAVCNYTGMSPKEFKTLMREVETVAPQVLEGFSS